MFKKLINFFRRPKIEIKNWSNDWLKINEQNILNINKKVTKPYTQSYVVYQAVSTIAANLPQAIYRLYNKNNNEELDLNHNIYKLVQKPNKQQTRYEFWEILTIYLNLYGEVMIYKAPSVAAAAGLSKVPAELIIIHPKYMRHNTKDGLITGWVYDNTVPFAPEEIIHIKLPNPYGDTLRGLSPIEVLQMELDTDYQAARYNKQFFSNNATPDGVIEIDKDLMLTEKELNRIITKWEKRHKGVDNRSKTAFLVGGMQYKTIGIPQKDMEYLAGRQFSRNAILSVYKVPPPVAGYYEDATYNNITMAHKALWTDCIKPILTRYEEKLQVELLNEIDTNIIGKFDLSNIEALKPDLKANVEAAQKLFMMGYNRNELNDRFKLNLPETPDGETRYLPINLVEVGSEQPKEPKKSITNTKQIINKKLNKYIRNYKKLQINEERNFHKKIKRYLMEQRAKVLQLLNKKDIDMASISAGLEALFDEEDKRLIKYTKPLYEHAINTATVLAGEYLDMTIEPTLNQQLINDAAQLITRINDTTKNEIRKAVKAAVKEGKSTDQLANDIRKIYNTWNKPKKGMQLTRAQTIARTETSRVMSGSTHTVYTQAGVKYKQWISAGDDKVRPEHIENEAQGKILIDQPFANGEMYPADKSINCRCTLVPVIEGV